GGDHLLVLLGAGLAVFLEDVAVTRLVLLRCLLELLADLLDRGDVLRALLLVTTLGRAERLLEGPALLLVEPLGLDVLVLGLAVLRSQALELAVAGAVRPALHEEGQLHHGEPALVLRPALVEEAPGVVRPRPALLPRLERRLVAGPELLERGALRA